MTLQKTYESYSSRRRITYHDQLGYLVKFRGCQKLLVHWKEATVLGVGLPIVWETSASVEEKMIDKNLMVCSRVLK